MELKGIIPALTTPFDGGGVAAERLAGGAVRWVAVDGRDDAVHHPEDAVGTDLIDDRGTITNIDFVVEYGVAEQYDMSSLLSLLSRQLRSCRQQPDAASDLKWMKISQRPFRNSFKFWKRKKPRMRIKATQ